MAKAPELIFDTDQIAFALAEAMSEALIRVGQNLQPPREAQPEEPDEEISGFESRIVEWPHQSRPPVMVARCPQCERQIVAEPLTWEIVIDPTATKGALAVRGLMQHTHDEGTLKIDTRWAFAAVYTPPPVEHDESETIKHETGPGKIADAVDDLEQGRTHVYDDDFEFGTDEHGQLPLSSAIYQALGAASTCWDSLRGAGVFHSLRALEIGQVLEAFIEREIERRIEDAS